MSSKPTGATIQTTDPPSNFNGDCNDFLPTSVWITPERCRKQDATQDATREGPGGHSLGMEALADFLWQDQWWDPWPLDARPRGSDAAIFRIGEHGTFWRNFAWEKVRHFPPGHRWTLQWPGERNICQAKEHPHAFFFQSVPSIILSLYRSHLCKYKNHWRFLSKLAAQQTFSWRVLLSLPLAWARSVTVSLSMEAFTKWRTSHRFRFRPFETLLIRLKKHVLVDGAAAGLGSDFLRAVWAAVFDLIWIDFGSGRSCKCRTCRTCNSTSGWCWKNILSRYFAHHL